MEYDFIFECFNARRLFLKKEDTRQEIMELKDFEDLYKHQYINSTPHLITKERLKEIRKIIKLLKRDIKEARVLHGI